MPVIVQGSDIQGHQDVGREKRTLEGLDILRAIPDLQDLQDTQQSSPLTRLPSEILARIFEVYMDDVTAWPKSPAPQSPFRLRHVCKLWRAIVESDARLWASIFFYFSGTLSHHKEDVSKVEEVFDLHLKQSGVLPIDFTFSGDGGRTNVENIASVLVDRLRTHSGRWKSIHLMFSCDLTLTLNPAFADPPCEFSSLEWVLIERQPLRWTMANLHLNLESAVNLKSFIYKGPGYPSDQFNLCCENLQDVSFEFVYYLTSVTLAQHIKSISSSQKLTSLNLELSSSRDTKYESETITLPTLKKLTIRDACDNFFDEKDHIAIKLLILPELETLEIISASTHKSPCIEDFHPQSFSNLLARSGCSLRDLCMSTVCLPPSDILRMLALSPALTTLELLPCPRSQCTIDVICALQSSYSLSQSQYAKDIQDLVPDVPLLPQLRDLTLGTWVDESTFPDSVIDMLQSRAGDLASVAGVVKLERVEVVFFHEDPSGGPNRGVISGAELEGLADYSALMARVGYQKLNREH